MRSVKICCSLFWLLFSAVMSREAFRLPMGEMRDPGAGFFPLMVALVTGLLGRDRPFPGLPGSRTGDPRKRHSAGALPLVEPRRHPGGPGRLCPDPDDRGLPGQHLLFMLLLLKVIEPQTWTKSLLASLITAVVSELFFNVLLSAQIPKGILGF